MKRALAKKDVSCDVTVLDKALSYHNERYTLSGDTQIGKRISSMPRAEVRYPTLGEQLLVNPFAKKEKTGKKKKKRK